MQALLNHFVLFALTFLPLIASLPGAALASEKSDAMPNAMEPPTAAPGNPLQPPRDCDWLVGQWEWFTGDVKTFGADHSMSDPSGEWTGTWACVDPASGTVVLDWNQGTFIDHLALNTDGSRLAGRNQYGVEVWGDRVDQ